MGNCCSARALPGAQLPPAGHPVRVCAGDANDNNLHSGYPTLRADADYCRFDPVQNGWWRCRYCTAYAK
jgi:hypothetical protein